MSVQRPMSDRARQSGLEALRAVVRRRNPGFDVTFQIEAHDGVAPAPLGEIGGSLAAPQDTGTLADRVGVATAAVGTPDEHAVDEPGQNLTPVRRGEG